MLRLLLPLALLCAAPALAQELVKLKVGQTVDVKLSAPNAVTRCEQQLVKVEADDTKPVVHLTGQTEGTTQCTFGPAKGTRTMVMLTVSK